MTASSASIGEASDIRGYGTAMVTCVFFSHPASVEHDTGPHPERRERIIAIERHLEQTGWFGFERRDAPRVDRELLETCHDPGYVGALQRLCAAGGGQIDDDTLVSEGSWEAAMRSAGGAVAVVDVLLSGEALAAFSAGRPPGHHALRARAMGFCLFNNIALAAIHAITAHALERVLILDWDVHHGNGTNDLFPSRVIPLARESRPQLILISAGYDAHADDPLADCLVTEGGYATMTTAMRRLAEELEVPVGVVLAGGYELGALARSVAATLHALSGDDR